MLLPAPLVALSARRGPVVLWVTCISIVLLLILAIINVMGPISDMNLVDQRILYNIVGLVIISLAASGWATNRLQSLNPAASFFSLLGTAIKMQFAALVFSA